MDAMERPDTNRCVCSRHATAKDGPTPVVFLVMLGIVSLVGLAIAGIGSTVGSQDITFFGERFAVMGAVGFIGLAIVIGCLVLAWMIVERAAAAWQAIHTR